MAEEIDFQKIEKKWQTRWEKEKAFDVKEDSKKKKCYVLEMYPYPSASFLHMGHVRNYTIGDVFARFRRMQGYNVLYPMGYDSFGLPAETAAKKQGIHPQKYTDDSIKKIMEYQKALGNSYDWERTLSSHEPQYYRWNQYFFLKLFEKGLAYRKNAPVNWCPNCQSVLANEEAEGGKCWRCNNDVIKKDMEQWFFKITDYADRLLTDLDKIEWPERIKTMQKNWIGKSPGTEIKFEIPTNLNFVLLHGYTGGPDKNFFPWLKKELETRGYKVTVPKLPNSDNPNIIEQTEYVLKNCKFDENTVLLGHNLGSVVALKVLDKLDKPIKKLITVAGFCIPRDKTNLRPFEKTIDWKFDFNKIKNNCKEILILRAKNDKDVTGERAESLKKYLNGPILEFNAEDYHASGVIEPVVLTNCLETWPVFTTRPDTIYGVTFMVISASHPRLLELTDKKQKKDVEAFIKICEKAKTPEEIEILDKDGVFIGKYAINPMTGEKIPVYAGNFVVSDYGSGMVMAVPAHDERDFLFAKKYKIPIKVVINPDSFELNPEKMSRAYTADGKLINSGEFNNWNNREAIEEITNQLAKKKLGKKTVNYKIRDWLISRQRYWGTPIPIIYCGKCGIVGVPEKNLPVLLPEKVDFKSTSSNPLTTNKEFLDVKCPKCKSNARRETDTMGGFVDSSWYFLRYCDNKNTQSPFDKKKVDYWMPVDQYVGGAEHAVMHLIYARFFIKALKDLGYISFDEPFKKLFNQGIVYKDGAKMSKSYGNVVFQTDISNKYGIDTARLFLMFVSSPDKQMEWSDQGVEGSYRIINKIIRLSDNLVKKSDVKQEHKINLAIKRVTESIESFDYPKSIISIVEFVDSFPESMTKENYEKVLKMISLFCPHTGEEMWEKIGNKKLISLESWPSYNEKNIDMKIEEAEKNLNKTVSDVLNVFNIIKEKQNKDCENVFIYVMPNELVNFDSSLLSKKIGKVVKVFAVNDKNKYDPEGKAGKAKPGKPGIFVQ